MKQLYVKIIGRQDMRLLKRKEDRPKYPPSVFEGIPQSIIPNPPPNARQTKQTSNHE